MWSAATQGASETDGGDQRVLNKRHVLQGLRQHNLTIDALIQKRAAEANKDWKFKTCDVDLVFF